MPAAAREAVLAMRANYQIGDDAYHRLEELPNRNRRQK